MSCVFKSSTVAMVMVLLATIAVAQANRDAKDANPDEPVIHDYILTVDKARKYAEIDKKVQIESKTNPSFAADFQKVEETSVNMEKAAMIERSARLAAFFKRNGTTAHDFIFTPLTILTAAMAISLEDEKKQAPSFVNPVNIKFVREHKDELEKMNVFGPDR